MCSSDLSKPDISATANTSLPARHNNSEVYRIRADHQRGRYWVLSNDNIRVYNARDRQLIATITLLGWNVAGGVSPPDLVLTSAGTALVSSNIVPEFWHIDPDRYTVMRQTVTLLTRENWGVGFSALAFTAEGTLFGVTAHAGTLWRINLEERTATHIEVPERLLDVRELHVEYQQQRSPMLLEPVLCVSGNTTRFRLVLNATTATPTATAFPGRC